MNGWRTTVAVVGMMAAVTTAAAILDARDRNAPLPVPSDRQLDLTSGQTAARVFMAFDALAADVYWIRTIQHYGLERKSRAVGARFALLQPLLDLTTTLDPKFNLAYRFGSIFLAMEPPDGPGRPDEAIALLEKGLAANPGRWQYTYDIGFIHYWYTGRTTEAGAWFERAAGMAGAPEWLQPLAAVTLVAGGDRAGARQLLGELQTSPEAYIRRAAYRGLAQIDALDAIDHLQAVVDVSPLPAHESRSWAALVRERRLPGIPLDSTGTPFVLDPMTSRVALSPSSSLNPMPKVLAHR